MKLRLLRFFARRPLTLLGAGAALVIGAAALIAGATSSRSDDLSPSETRFDAPSGALSDPRLILGRGWWDSLPQKRTDVVKLYFFGGGGIGIYEEGSVYRYAVDVFELERQHDKLSMKFLHDGKTAETRFTVSPCDEKPPFDLCLDIPDTPRGPKRYYSFGDDEDFAHHIPWGPEQLRAAARSSHLR